MMGASSCRRIDIESLNAEALVVLKEPSMKSEVWSLSESFDSSELERKMQSDAAQEFKEKF